MHEEQLDALVGWATDQRAMARTLDLSIAQWMDALDAAAQRKTGLTAAVVGAAMARGLGLGVLDRLDGPALAVRARALLDPSPPKVRNPVLAEAIRRADELPDAEGRGAARLRRRAEVETPQRQTEALGPSASVATPDAPGDDS